MSLLLDTLSDPQWWYFIGGVFVLQAACFQLVRGLLWRGKKFTWSEIALWHTPLLGILGLFGKFVITSIKDAKEKDKFRGI